MRYFFFFITTDGWRSICSSRFQGSSFSGFTRAPLRRKSLVRGFSQSCGSRVSPLHFATLLAVALWQLARKEMTGEFFVYPFNDSYHFLLNLLFASSWGLERGNAFNGPIWSVSVEVLLYAMFFAYCRVFPRRLWILLVISAVGFLLVTRIYDQVGRGIGAFFSGGCAYLVYERIVMGGDRWKVTRWLPCVSACAWLATFITAKHGLNLDFLSLHSDPYVWRVAPYVLWGAEKVVFHWPAILFPLTILPLALIEHENGLLGKGFAWLGDISYSSYLLHFPLQLAVIGAVAYLQIGQWLFHSPWFMASFFGVLVLLSLGLDARQN